MEQVSNIADPTNINVAKRMLDLENQIKGGANWFFWIAGLSILNTILFFTGGTITFVVGLAITQFIDGFISALVSDVGSEAGVIFRAIGIFLDVVFAGIFVVCGVMGQKRFRWVMIGGMVLYAVDGLLFLAFGDWLATLFHVLALAGLWKGQKAIRELEIFEKTQASGDLTSLQMLIAAPLQLKTTQRPRNLGRSILMLFVFLLIFIVGMVLLDLR